MSQQIIIPASIDDIRVDFISAGQTVIPSFTFPSSSQDRVIDVVLTYINKPPVVNAGSSQEVTLPSSFFLSATASDPDGNIASYLWEKVSGPSATIVSPTAVSTEVKDLAAGDYVFKITVIDNSGDTASATVAGKINPAPVPIASTPSILSSNSKFGTAGLSHALTGVPAGALLVVATTFEGSGKSATVSSTPALSWIKQVDAQVSGSGDVEIYTAVSAGGNVTISTNWGAGFQTSVAYVVIDQEAVLGGAKATATLQAIPSVPITTTRENSLLIAATSDWNAKDGTVRTYRDSAVEVLYKRGAIKEGTAYHYVKQAGVIKSYTEGLTTPTAQSAGTVILEIRGKSGSAPSNQAPIVSAGSDQSITSPANSVNLSGLASDPDGTIASYAWSKMSGVGGSITSPSLASTSVTSLSEGVYVFRLTATDDKGLQGFDEITVTVNPASNPTPPGTIQGFGADAVGGANSADVRRVTTAAQFTSAIGSNRTIIFDADVTFTGASARWDFSNTSYLTIDANGHDVTVNNGNSGDAISFGSGSHHCILKGVRAINAGGDGINAVDGAHDIVITNCSSYDNRDGNIDIAGDSTGLTKNITVQWCIIGRGQQNDTSYSGCALVTGQSVSEHHNLFVPSTVNGVGERNPLVHCNYSPVGSPNCDFRNNLIWKWGRSNGTGSGYGTDINYSAAANVVNNYYYSTSDPGNAVVTNGSYGSTPAGSAYVAGNVSGNTGVNPNSQSNHAEYAIASKYQITSQSACASAVDVLAKAGPAKRDATEQGWINSIILNGC